MKIEGVLVYLFLFISSNIAYCQSTITDKYLYSKNRFATYNHSTNMLEYSCDEFYFVLVDSYMKKASNENISSYDLEFDWPNTAYKKHTNKREKYYILKFTGTVNYYNSSGILSQTREFFSGYEQGNRVFYWDNGKVKSKSYYFMGKQNGKSYSYYVNGIKSTEEEYNIEGYLEKMTSYNSLGEIEYTRVFLRKEKTANPYPCKSISDNKYYYLQTNYNKGQKTNSFEINLSF